MVRKIVLQLLSSTKDNVLNYYNYVVDGISICGNNILNSIRVVRINDSHRVGNNAIIISEKYVGRRNNKWWAEGANRS